MNHEPHTPSEVPARDKQEGEVKQPTQQSPDLWKRYGAERGIWSEAMLIALQKAGKGNKWFSLTDKIVSDRTLGKAWEQVRENAGSCGVDRIDVGYFEKDSQTRLLAVKEHLAKNTYRPDAIRRVNIPKPGSKETRPLGIPTVRDRIVQTAIKMVIRHKRVAANQSLSATSRPTAMDFDPDAVQKMRYAKWKTSSKAATTTS